MKFDLPKVKSAFASSGIFYATDEEYIEAMHNLVNYFDILIQMDLKQSNKTNNLKKEFTDE